MTATLRARISRIGIEVPFRVLELSVPSFKNLINRVMVPGGGTSPVHISPLRQFRGDLGQSPTLSGPKLDNQPTDQQFLFIGNELAVLDAVAVSRLSFMLSGKSAINTAARAAMAM